MLFVLIEKFWKDGTEQDWQSALEHYYEMLYEEQEKLDEFIKNVKPETIKSLPVTEFYDFLFDKYFVWKYTQKNRLSTTRKALKKYIDEKRLDELEKIQKELFYMSHDDAEACIRVATKIKGLGTAGASGLLAILFPEDFGTVDQFVVKTLVAANDEKYINELKKVKPNWISKKQGSMLISILREKAKELNRRFSTEFWTPRKVDMVLWSLGRSR